MADAEPESDYDTDTISLTSTDESEHDPEKTFDVKEILSEKVRPDKKGNKVIKYLIEWEGYPKHK